MARTIYYDVICRLGPKDSSKRNRYRGRSSGIAHPYGLTLAEAKKYLAQQLSMIKGWNYRNAVACKIKRSSAHPQRRKHGKWARIQASI